VTGGAVLRAGARIYFGLGPVPNDSDTHETSGDEERPESAPMPRARATMVVPIVALLAGSLAVGVVPALARSISRASVEFVDPAGYVAQALSGAAAASASALPEAAWTSTGVLLGLASALLAVAVAAAGLWGARLPAVLRRGLRPLDPAVTALRRLHSGHVGDYVAWLFVGVTALTALVGVPLL